MYDKKKVDCTESFFVWEIFKDKMLLAVEISQQYNHLNHFSFACPTFA